ncbi:conserved protein of unknown function [Petrocella atlantisensis]|uniref:Glycosyl transferase family 1 domain-containing protein n=1 Tax=Petrocella atlantisensis TaxID=2173034 RepID=A0A3P7PNZ7_9FIRM|nr:glycosyltransferase [Petrocella atlantisensis]VDN46217.1 conserved protein of unknown function [Petrocella atlantisensis]
MSKGTILYVGGFELPDKNAAAHRVLSNGKIIRELGYKVVFIDVDKELKYGSDVRNTKHIIQEFECWSIPYPSTKVQWINYLSNIDTSIEVLNQYEDVKVIIAYNYPAIPLWRLKNYCARNSIKIVADCTEWYSTKGQSIIFKFIKGIDSLLRMRVIQKRLDGLIVISSYLKNYYHRSTNVVRVPPLIDISEEKWNTTVSEFDSDKLNLVYAGSPGKTKDKLKFFIESLYEFKEVSNFSLNIIGITKEQYIDVFKELEPKLNQLGEKIVFHGRLSHVDSLKFVMMSDFSVFFRDDTRTTKAGFPTKFVESISCGTPVITTRTSDLERYILEGENGFFIDIKDKKNVLLLLSKVFDMKKEDINRMKKKCIESNIFYFRNYNNKIRQFLHVIQSNSE